MKPFQTAVLALLMMTFMACGAAPTFEPETGLTATVRVAATASLGGQGEVRLVRIADLGDGRTKITVRLRSGGNPIARVNTAVAQAVFGTLNNIVLDTQNESEGEVQPLLLCPGSPIFSGYAGRAKPSALSDSKIGLNPGHGWTQYESGVWKLQRPNPNPNGTPPVYVQEDSNNLETAIFVNNALSAAGATVLASRNLDKNAGVGASGNPRWQEAAKHHLEREGVPGGVWDSERAAKDQDCFEDKDVRARPLHANWWGADALVALHSNAVGASTNWQAARGTRIFYTTDNIFPGTPGSQQIESAKLANELGKSVVAAIRKARPDLNWPDPQITGSTNYGELRFAQMPAVLIETGFHTNGIDGPALAEDSFRQAVAKGVRDGLKAWLGDTSPSDGGIVISPLPAFPSAPNPTTPGSPSTLQVKSNGAVPFQWQGVQGATRYGLYISKFPYGEANLVYKNEQIAATATSIALSVSDFRLAGESRYRWNMVAFDGPLETNVGRFSERLDFTVVDALPLPSLPPSLSVVMSSEGRMLLSWAEVANVRDYGFDASVDGVAATVVGLAASRGTGMNAAVVTPDPSVVNAPGKSVCFRVRANNPTGSSDFGAASCVMFQFFAAGIQVQSVAGGAVQLRLVMP